MISKELKRAVGKYISFTQIDCFGGVDGYVDKAWVSKTYHAYWNSKDNPRCRRFPGEINPGEKPSWADFGWKLANTCDCWYRDLRILDEEDLGTW